MMKKSLLAILLVSVFSITTHAGLFSSGIEGSGEVVPEKRDVEFFDSVTLVGSMDAVITPGETQSVVVHAEENLLSIVTTEVKGNTLILKTTESYNTKIGIKVMISIPEINGLKVKGSGDIILEKGFSGKNLDLIVSGSGDVIAEKVEYENLNCKVNGSGDIHLSGEVEKAMLNVNGSGDITASKLIAQVVVARVKGSGDIETHAIKTLDAKIMGSGDILYSGSAEVTQKVLGSGEITGK